MMLTRGNFSTEVRVRPRGLHGCRQNSLPSLVFEVLPMSEEADSRHAQRTPTQALLSSVLRGTILSEGTRFIYLADVLNIVIAG